MCTRPARRYSRFCCAACERLGEQEAEREPERESVEEQGDNAGRVWQGGRKLSLQNSA